MQTKQRLLLIDDEEGVLKAFTLMLQAFGFEVAAFSDPEEAIASLASNSPDWIISDLRMPKRDGFGVLEYRNEHFQDIPFILISGHAKEAEIEKAKALGAVAVLQKPFAPTDLVELMTSAAAKKASGE